MSFLNKLEDFLGSKDAAKKYESKKNRLEHGDQIQILFESKTIQDLFKKEQFTKKKSTLDAKRFRDLGNEAYKSSQDIKALELYSRSCQTSTNDNELALALANRSAAALRLGKWTTALQNVELAIHINSYPPENLYKLHERRAKIYVHMGKKEEASSEYLRASKLVQDPTKASEFITLSEKSFDTFEKEIIVPENAKDKGLDAISFTPNTNFPGLSNAVNIVYEDTKGRFGVATRDIQVGEYIGVEEPVVSRIKKMYQGSHCNGCMQSLEDSCFLPCLHCEDANYCSLVCRSKSFESYHKYECGLSTFLEDALIKMKGKSSEIDDYYRLGFRSISQRPMEYFRKSYNELINASSQLEKDQIFDQKDYKSLSSLVDNYKDGEKDNLWVQISVCFIIRSLREKGYFGESNSKKLNSKSLSNDERIIANLCRRFIQILKYNTHGVFEAFSYKDVRSRVFANGIYSNLAMLNHSCAPNVTKFFRGNKVYVLASAYILKGTEISENYFPYYIFMDKHTRMPWLKDHYCFECNCVACFSNYPLLSDMQKTCPRNYLCSKCKVVLESEKESNEYLVCSKCSEKFLYENLKNDVVGLQDELQYRFDNKLCPEALLEIGQTLATKVVEPDPHLYKFQKLFGFSVKYMKGNKAPLYVI